MINLHIEGDMYEYICTELSACVFGKDMFVDCIVIDTCIV